MSDWDDIGERYETAGNRWGLRVARHPILSCLTALIAVVLLSIAGWAVDVALSGPKGAGDAYVQKQSAQNRIEAQSQFHTTFTTIRSLDQRLSDAEKAYDTFVSQHPSVDNGSLYNPNAEQEANLQRTMTGLQNECRQAVADYDASTEQYLLRDFRDTDLPYKIAESDPLFQSGRANWADYDCAATPEETK